MARSRKKVCVWKNHNSKHMKRFANKTVRHTKDIPNGMAYKKLFCSWDICDYKSLCFDPITIQEFADKYYNGRTYSFYMK